MTPVIVIHGGAGTISRGCMTDAMEKEYTQALTDIVAAGSKVLADGGSALDAVTEAVRLLEECPLFNAGKGSVFTAAETHEMDASVMDGSNLKAGAVGAVRTIRNPVKAARAVMERTDHVLLIGEGAEAFAATQADLEIVDPKFFYTQNRMDQLLRAKEMSVTVLDHDGAAKGTPSPPKSPMFLEGVEPLDPDRKFGTVGAVALDCLGNLAAATSTGGMTNKMAGRVGDSPIIGAGTYANNETAAISTTGTGEMFIRAVAAYSVSAMIKYGKHTLESAGDIVVHQDLPKIGGHGGLIAVDREGNITMPFNTEGMYRGYARVGEQPTVYLYGKPSNQQ
eukprot:gene2918-3353_t